MTTSPEPSTLNLSSLEASLPPPSPSDCSTLVNDQSPFYITTAIHYTNGNPHIGHAYENITADAIARFHRIYNGRPVFFLTGTDEHGQKIASTAEANGMTPMDLVNTYAAKFEQLATDLNLSHDRFIRTTSKEHQTIAQWAFMKSHAAGDITKGTYKGWYNVREETFVNETDAQAADYKDVASGAPLVEMEEESYFFNMGRYQAQLLDHYDAHPDFCLPLDRRDLILHRLRNETLRPLSVSRNTFSHGIPVPLDPSHVMYVWFDALANYLSGIGYPDSDQASFWPANVHIIGKDIIWFHCVIWPCMLMSIGMSLPTTIFGHGFVNALDGRKMSKSLGNVVDPNEILAMYSLDTVRYFLCRGSVYGSDMPFSHADLIATHNAELADALGNVVHRALNLCQKYSAGVIPDVTTEAIFNVQALVMGLQEAMVVYNLSGACLLVLAAVKQVNKYLTDRAPWHVKDNLEWQQSITRSTLEALYVVAHGIAPFMPSTSEALWVKLNTPAVTLVSLPLAKTHLVPGTLTMVGDILFAKLLTAEQKAKAAVAQNTTVKVVKVDKVKPVLQVFGSMHLVVARIRKCWPHESLEEVMCCELAVDTADTVVLTGLNIAGFTTTVTMDQLVCVVLNLKPVKLAGFKSHGTLLCAANDTHVELIQPPVGAILGERLYIASQQEVPVVSAAQMKKQAIMDKAMTMLRTNASAVATFGEEIVMTSAGPCAAPTLSSALIR